MEADEYLHQLSRYIYLNPVRAGLVKEPGDYPYSSYQYFTSNARAPDWLILNFILSLFDKNVKKAKSLYKKFVLEGMGKETEAIRKNMCRRVDHKRTKDKKPNQIIAEMEKLLIIET